MTEAELKQLEEDRVLVMDIQAASHVLVSVAQEPLRQGECLGAGERRRLRGLLELLRVLP